jgi:multisubunit Na+/H+ antiporter MnhG subunit
VSGHAWLLWALLGPAVLLAMLSALGVLVMRDPLQKLHYLAPPATVSATLIAIAAYCDGRGWQPGNKALIVAVVLTVMNGVASHATARAAWVRALGRWTPNPHAAAAFEKRSAHEPGWEDSA